MTETEPTEALLRQLRSSADFLALSLQYPDTLPALSFRLNNGTQVEVWDSGVICIEPKVRGEKDIVISSGVHGNETAPIELCNQILCDILQEKLEVFERSLFLFGNPLAIKAGVREVQDNLNRLFSGHHSLDGKQSAERERAKKLEHFVQHFFKQAPQGVRVRKLYDLHTAIRGSRFEKFAIYPFLHGRDWSQAELLFLKACGIRTFLLMQTPTSTFSYFAAEHCQADGFTLELGQVRPFGENDLTRFQEADSALRALLTGGFVAESDFDEDDFHFYQVRRAINKQSEAFRLCFANSIENFTTFSVGTLLAEDAGVEYRTEVEGEAVIFPNPNVALGQRAMLLVTPTQVTGRVS